MLDALACSLLRHRNVIGAMIACSTLIGCTTAATPPARPSPAVAHASFSVLVQRDATPGGVDPVDTYAAVLASRSFAASIGARDLTVRRMGRGAVIQATVSARSNEEAMALCGAALRAAPRVFPGEQEAERALTERIEVLRSQLMNAEAIEHEFAQKNGLVALPLTEQLAAARKRLVSLDDALARGERRAGLAAEIEAVRKEAVRLAVLELESRRLAKHTATLRTMLDHHQERLAMASSASGSSGGRPAVIIVDPCSLAASSATDVLVLGHVAALVR